MIRKELRMRILSSIILVPLSLFFIIQGSHIFNFFILICFIITNYEWYKMAKNKIYYIVGIIFLIFSFYTIYALRNELNYVVFLFIVLVCISSDIGGYVFGKIFKGPKLTKISPNKTYAGTIGGYILSLFFVFCYLRIYDLKISIFSAENIYFAVLLISTISQLGDLTISFFKRLSQIKNTGNIIPGHGGILDRIDGMIFVFPIFYLITRTDLFNF